MCYSGCLFENYHGACMNAASNSKSPLAHCYEPPEEDEDTIKEITL